MGLLPEDSLPQWLTLVFPSQSIGTGKQKLILVGQLLDGFLGDRQKLRQVVDLFVFVYQLAFKLLYPSVFFIKQSS